LLKEAKNQVARPGQADGSPVVEEYDEYLLDSPETIRKQQAVCYGSLDTTNDHSSPLMTRVAMRSSKNYKNN